MVHFDQNVNSVFNTLYVTIPAHLAGIEHQGVWERWNEDEMAKADRGASTMFRRDGSVSTKTGSKISTYKLLSNGAAAIQLKSNGQLLPDREQMATFIKTLFKHATSGTWVSLRAFPDKGSGHSKAFEIVPVKLNGNLDYLVDKAYSCAERAAKSGDKIVFCPPVATFTNKDHAREEDLAEGLVLSTECDEHAQEACNKLQELLGPPTAVVKSGGEWMNPETGELEPKLHDYYRLKIPARDPETLKKLKQARELATEIVGGDASNVSAVHPIRWPGSLHRKAEPKLCCIITINPDAEIDLDQALDILRKARSHSGNGYDVDAPDYDPWEKYEINYKEPIDPDVELDQMQYHDKEHGIDRTQLRVIGHYASQGDYDLDQVIDYIVAKTFEVVPESATWHGGNRVAAEREEVSKLRDMCVRTYKKFPQHVEKQSNWPEWATDDRRLKKLLNGASPGVGSTENIVQFPASSSALPPKKPEKVLPKLEYITLKDLRHELLKHVSWIVDKFILAGTVNGLFGDGATGKDQLLFQLAIALVSGAKWLGIEVPTTWNGEPIRVLWFPVEDPKEELRRRQHNIETYYAERAARHDEVFELQEDNLRIIPQIGKDTVIAIYDHEAGMVKSTSLYTQMCVEIAEFKPHVVIVGNRVNIFSVNQNDDAQARQCINLLNHICEKYGATVIMPAHPSQTGKNTGSGESGSVQWSNAVRQRLYLSKIKGEKGEPEPDPYARQLEVMKSNWAGSGEIINMQWTKVIDESGQWYGGGVFVEDQVVMVKDENGEAKTDTQIKLEENTKIDADFMEMFDKATKMGITLSHKTRAEITHRPSSPNSLNAATAIRKESCRCARQ